jgi:hypothetical protein
MRQARHWRHVHRRETSCQSLFLFSQPLGTFGQTSFALTTDDIFIYFPPTPSFTIAFKELSPFSEQLSRLSSASQGALISLASPSSPAFSSISTDGCPLSSSGEALTSTSSPSLQLSKPSLTSASSNSLQPFPTSATYESRSFHFRTPTGLRTTASSLLALRSLSPLVLAPLLLRLSSSSSSRTNPSPADARHQSSARRKLSWSSPGCSRRDGRSSGRWGRRAGDASEPCVTELLG